MIQSATSALDSFGRDLTDMARQSRLDPLIGRAIEIERVVQILSRRAKNNVVLLGEAGVGKSAIVEGLAQLIIDGNIAEHLRDRRIVMLDLAAIVAGTTDRGQIEERVKAVVDEARQSNNTILFIDDLHTFVGVGRGEGAVDVSNVLVPALARGEIQCIAATTLDQYRKHIEMVGVFVRHFQTITVKPPSKTEALDILRGLRDRYETHHRVEISDGALDRHAVAAVVAQMTGIPLSIIESDPIERFDHLEADLSKRVIGQPGALRQVGDVLRQSAVGLNNPDRPMGCLLFAGPTGTGKSYLARILAETTFGSPEALICVDMAQFSGEGAAERLLAAEGPLVGALRRRPDSLVLLESIDKANPLALHVLHGVMDTGRLTDGSGRTVDLRPALLVMTLTMGAEALTTSNSFGFPGSRDDGDDPYLSARSREMLALDLERIFKPEFLARIDQPVLFRKLGLKDVRQLVLLELVRLRTCIEETLGLTLDLPEEVVEHLIVTAYEPDLGAGAFLRKFVGPIETAIDEARRRGQLVGASHVIVRLDVGGDGMPRLAIEIVS